MKSFLHINPYSGRFEQLVMVIILINSLVIFFDASGVHSQLLIYADILCSIFFIFEMALKMYTDGILGYWRSGWNRFDGTLVILSIPSLLVGIIPITDISFLLIFRMLRAFRFFRLIHFFPGAAQIGRSFKKALQESLSLFVGYLIVILILALLSTSLFGQIAPQYFGTPMDSIYSTFRLCTIEGWYDIPDTVAQAYGSWGIFAVRLYFIFILVLGGIIGLSLINSVFVDAMASDNNDEVLNRIDNLEGKIDKLLKQQQDLLNKNTIKNK